MKIAVYTIALNEAKHAERWANSATDADYRVVADTGSTDDTVERLTRAGVTVHRFAIRPWRFDDARNAAMALIPADVDVCCSMDMDEYLEPGWRQRLEAAWVPGTTALTCRKASRSGVDDPTPFKTFAVKNFHSRWEYRFKRPVHEHLTFTGAGGEVTADCAEIVISHVQDHAKTTRNQYIPLMELAHKEDPSDGQICFWLGRDYMWAKQNERAVALLREYLALPSSTWGEERSEAMRYLARLQPDEKLIWLDKARMEAPHRREIWHDLAEELHSRYDWLNLFWACANGIEKTRRTGSYLDDQNYWGFRLFDLGAIAAWHLNAMDRAVEWGGKALELDRGNQRLRNNLDFFVKLREDDRKRASNIPVPVEETLGNSFETRYTLYYQKNRASFLNALCDKYGSDKGEINGSGHPYPWPSHTYADFVERRFEHCREYVSNVFECGLGTNDPDRKSSMGAQAKPGASLRVWRDYFPNAKIYGVDIDQSILFTEDRIASFYCDQTSAESISLLFERLKNVEFDLMIDDGLHTFEAGRCLLENSYHRLKAGGIYIIEDVTVASLLQFKKYFVEKQFNYEFVTLYRKSLPLGDNSLVVIRK